MAQQTRVAIIGSGISGLAVAHALHHEADLTLFEQDHYFGGHAHTVDVTLPTAQGPMTYGVDTGFLVLNERTYPELLRLFDELKVDIAPSDMSFSVQVPRQAKTPSDRLEWSGSNFASLFAQPSNLLRPRFWGMLQDILRFNKLCTSLAESGQEKALMQPLREFLDEHGFGTGFREWYFLPMLGCIWSCPTDQMLQFPVATMIRFCHNHGLLQVNNRPQWYTVRGGSRHYVQRIIDQLSDVRLNTPVLGVERDANGVWVSTAHGREQFDHVVLACHSDQSLALLSDASGEERSVLGAIRYQPNVAVLHTDASVLPQRRMAWAAWNFEGEASSSQSQGHDARICLHYLLNQLQPIPFDQPVIVSLNPVRPIAEDTVLGRFEYAHPVFDVAAIRAQQRVPQLQGRGGVWFCGAWTGYGFHEDGLKSGLTVASALKAQWSAAASGAKP